MKVLFLFIILISHMGYATNLRLEPLTTSLSDETLEYEPIEPFKLNEDTTDRQDIFEAVQDLLKLHNFINALNDYKNLCLEKDEAETLINEEKDMESQIIRKIVEKFGKDGVANGSSFIDEYRTSVSEINLVFEYNTAAKGLGDVCTDESGLNDLAKAVKDKYLALKESNNINMSDVCSNLDTLFKNFLAARDVLAEAYMNATNLPDDVAFFKNTPQWGSLDNDGYKNVPILESTKYIGDICPNNSGENKFYKIPSVWSKTYPNFWENCWCRLEEGAMANQPCCGQTCAAAGKLKNIKEYGEWITYLKTPSMAPRRTPGGEKVCTLQRFDGTYKLVKEGYKHHFRNRFEDYDRCQLALFRAFENKRNICRVLDVMKEEIKNSYRIFKEDENETGMDDLSCKNVSSKIRELRVEKDEKIQEIQPYISVEDEELQTLFDKIKDDADAKYMITNFMVENSWEQLTEEQDASDNLNTPTKVYREELSDFKSNVETVWGIIYSDRF